MRISKSNDCNWLALKRCSFSTCNQRVATAKRCLARMQNAKLQKIGNKTHACTEMIPTSGYTKRFGSHANVWILLYWRFRSRRSAGADIVQLKPHRSFASIFATLLLFFHVCIVNAVNFDWSASRANTRLLHCISLCLAAVPATQFFFWKRTIEPQFKRRKKEEKKIEGTGEGIEINM